MLTGINDENYVPGFNASAPKTNKQIIEAIFGTTSQPTTGTFYYITDDKIEQTITSDIYNTLMPTKTYLRNIQIVDYFPAEIVKNFDFAYVTESNIGDISAKIDTTTNSITWTIPELASGETATVQYKLKLKENYDSSIVGKLLDTNEKVDVTYTDPDDKEQSKTSDVTPKLKLSEPPAELPKAGTVWFIGIGAVALGALLISGIKLTSLNRKIK
jgi:hypothetical protein